LHRGDERVSEARERLMRTMFLIYAVVIAGGIVCFLIVGVQG
jgi:hypothetical protein